MEFLIRSPYLLETKPLVFPKNVPPVVMAIEEIISPSDLTTNPWYQTKIGQVATTYRGFVAAEFFRRFTGLPFPHFKAGQPAGLRRMVDKEVKLWLSTYIVLERMRSLNLLWQHESIIFLGLVKEYALLTPGFKCVGEGENISARKTFAKTEPKINMALSDACRENNPFNRHGTPQTHLFVDLAFRLINPFGSEDPGVKTTSGDHFRKQIWGKLIADRKALVAEIRNQNPRTFGGNGKMKRQGERADLLKNRRDKTTKNKLLSETLI